jgi:hypothetical protein
MHALNPTEIDESTLETFEQTGIETGQSSALNNQVSKNLCKSSSTQIRKCRHHVMCKKQAAYQISIPSSSNSIEALRNIDLDTGKNAPEDCKSSLLTIVSGVTVDAGRGWSVPAEVPAGSSASAGASGYSPRGPFVAWPRSAPAGVLFAIFTGICAVMSSIRFWYGSFAIELHASYTCTRN